MQLIIYDVIAIEAQAIWLWNPHSQQSFRIIEEGE